MNSKLSTVVSLALLFIVIMIWSISILATEQTTQKIPVAVATSPTLHLAARANTEAVQAAARSILEDTRLDLDMRLVGPTVVQVAAE